MQTVSNKELLNLASIFRSQNLLIHQLQRQNELLTLLLATYYPSETFKQTINDNIYITVHFPDGAHQKVIKTYTKESSFLEDKEEDFVMIQDSNSSLKKEFLRRTLINETDKIKEK